MNQRKSKLLRKLFIAPFGPNDPRNHAAFRTFKREYAKMPRPLRGELLKKLTLLRENSPVQTEGV